MVGSVKTSSRYFSLNCGGHLQLRHLLSSITTEYQVYPKINQGLTKESKSTNENRDNKIQAIYTAQTNKQQNWYRYLGQRKTILRKALGPKTIYGERQHQHIP